MNRRWIPCLLLISAIVLGCGAPAEDTAPEPAAPPAPETAAEPTMSAIPANADDLWAHLEAEVYQDNWDLWPGRGELYEGTEPHGALLTTYVNDTASEALEAGEMPLPAGSIVVKENYMPDNSLAAVTVMYKAAGSNPDFNDWFWLKRLTDGTVEASGQVQMCQGCHAQATSFDYLVTALKDSQMAEGDTPPRAIAQE